MSSPLRDCVRSRKSEHGLDIAICGDVSHNVGKNLVRIVSLGDEFQEGADMESPRKRMDKSNSHGKRGQVIDLRAYQRRRDRKHRGAPYEGLTGLWLLRYTCYALAVVAVAFAIVGLCPVG